MCFPVTSSMAARNAAGRTPLMPPPSIDRILLDAIASHLRMIAAAVPLARRQPILEVEEPENGPWNYRVDEPPVRRPLAAAGYVQTELHGLLLVDVRYVSPSAQLREIGSYDDDIRRISLSIADT